MGTSNQTQRTFTDAASNAENFGRRSSVNAIEGLGNVSEGFGRLADLLGPQVGRLLEQFQGLPDIGEALGFLQGGATQDQRDLLDRRAAQATRGGEQLFNSQLDQIFERAGGQANILGAQAGLRGSFQTAPIDQAARGAAQGAASLGANRQNIRAGIGQQFGGGILTAQQAALGGLRDITGLVAGLRGQEGNAQAQGADIGSRLQGLEQQFRLGTATKQTSQSKSPFDMATQLGALALLATPAGPAAAAAGQGANTFSPFVNTPGFGQGLVNPNGGSGTFGPGF